MSADCSDVSDGRENGPGVAGPGGDDDDHGGTGGDRDEDPRLTDEYVRRVEGDGVGDVVVVGAVHDHPASSYRVREFVREADPDVLALELTPLSLPWFEATAEATSDCEMRAAIAAAPDARTVGVDGFDAGFVRTLAANLRAEGPSRGTVRAVARGVVSVLRRGVACRLAALVDRYTPYRPAVAEPGAYDCDRTDPPAVQAADERRHASTSLALLRAADPPTPVAVRDDTREACMVRRVRRLREAGDVVAVVGLGHLDAVAGGLEAAR